MIEKREKKFTNDKIGLENTTTDYNKFADTEQNDFVEIKTYFIK